MSYSPAKCPLGGYMNETENHEKIFIEVYSIDGKFVESVLRTVMTNEGKRYVTYKRKQYQVKKMKELKEGFFMLKIMGR